MLIVVAIIAILAAIAVPNFLEAQVRSKVSRVKADIRTLATALECYAVDQNAYPPHNEIKTNGTYNVPAYQAGLYTIDTTPWTLLTTPVAYLTGALVDPFAVDLRRINSGVTQPTYLQGSNPFYLKSYSYIDSATMRNIFLSKGPSFVAAAEAILPAYGTWRIYGCGPDQDKGVDTKKSVPYDPTNGTTSDGDVIRSQRRPDELTAADEGS